MHSEMPGAPQHATTTHSVLCGHLHPLPLAPGLNSSGVSGALTSLQRVGGGGCEARPLPVGPSPHCQHTRQDLFAAPGLPRPSATLSLQELAGTPRLESSLKRV